MNTQQECPECPDNGSLSWQEPAVIPLCHESEVFGILPDCDSGSGADEGCIDGNNAFYWCDTGYAH